LHLIRVNSCVLCTDSSLYMSNVSQSGDSGRIKTLVLTIFTRHKRLASAIPPMNHNPFTVVVPMEMRFSCLCRETLMPRTAILEKDAMIHFSRIVCGAVDMDHVPCCKTTRPPWTCILLLPNGRSSKASGDIGCGFLSTAFRVFLLLVRTPFSNYDKRRTLRTSSSICSSIDPSPL
jgi:hypothetical protein